MNYAQMSKARYLFYLLVHPVTAFEEMKFNKKGSVKYATLLLALFYVCSVVSQVGTGYLFKDKNLEDVNIFGILAGTVGLVIVWCVANWMLCTLLDGKGRFSEIWVATCYSLLPYVLFSIPMTVLSHFLTNNEAMFYQAAMTLITVWVADHAPVQPVQERADHGVHRGGHRADFVLAGADVHPGAKRGVLHSDHI